MNVFSELDDIDFNNIEESKEREEINIYIVKKKKRNQLETIVEGLRLSNEESKKFLKDIKMTGRSGSLKSIKEEEKVVEKYIFSGDCSIFILKLLLKMGKNESDINIDVKDSR